MSCPHCGCDCASEKGYWVNVSVALFVVAKDEEGAQKKAIETVVNGCNVDPVTVHVVHVEEDN